MKGLHPFFAMLLLAGCDRCKDVSAPGPTDEEEPCKLTATYRGERMSFATWKERIAAEQEAARSVIAERQRVQDLPRFENALEVEGDNSVVRAFVIEKGAHGEISVVERIHGRVPSDPEKYVAEAKPPGQYLVGSLVPRGGYSIQGSRFEERFCLSFTKHGRFLRGEGVARLLRIEDVKQRLTRPADSQK
jgi:hypothetical protein